MEEKIKQTIFIVVLTFTVPFVITLLFAFFWNFPDFVIQIIDGGERLLPILTVSIFWKIYGVFLSLWSILLLYVLSFQD
ncbi:hypothetical protein [Streptococcus dentiloxodontae]